MEHLRNLAGVVAVAGVVAGGVAWGQEARPRPDSALVDAASHVGALASLVQTQTSAEQRRATIMGVVGAERGGALEEVTRTRYGVVMNWAAGRLIREGYPEDARAVLEELVGSAAHARDRVAGWARLGQLHSAAGRRGEAISAYEEMMRVAEGEPEGRRTSLYETGGLNLVTQYRMTRRYAEAFEVLEKLVGTGGDRSPNRLSMERQRVYVLDELGDARGALGLAEEYLTSHPTWDPADGERVGFCGYMISLTRRAAPERALVEARRAWERYRERNSEAVSGLAREVAMVYDAQPDRGAFIGFQAERLEVLDRLAGLVRSPGLADEIDAVLVSLQDADRVGRADLALMALLRREPRVEAENAPEHRRAIDRARAAVARGQGR